MKPRLHIWLALLASTLPWVVGCGGEEEQAPPEKTPPVTFAGSCMDQSAQFCTDFVGGGFDATNIRDLCGLGGNTYSADHCSTARLVGTCTVRAGTDQEEVGYFYSGDPVALEDGCAMRSGVWRLAG